MISDSLFDKLLKAFNFDNYMENKIKEIYDNVKLEQINVNKTPDEVSAFIEFTFLELKSGTKPQDIQRHFSSNRHMNFFDNFMYEGASAEVTAALNKVGLGTDVLKGIKSNQSQHFEFMTPVGELNIYNTWVQQGRSKHLEFFTIYLNGEIIFNFDGGKW